MDYSSKWTTGQNGLLNKMDYSTKWSTQQNGIISKIDYSTKWNTQHKFYLPLGNMSILFFN